VVERAFVHAAILIEGCNDYIGVICRADALLQVTFELLCRGLETGHGRGPSRPVPPAPSRHANARPNPDRACAARPLTAQAFNGNAYLGTQLIVELDWKGSMNPGDLETLLEPRR
jgi:hypothetical protein